MWGFMVAYQGNSRRRKTQSPANSRRSCSGLRVMACECDPDLQFVDDGYSGFTLARPALERLRDQAAAGAIDRLYVLDPDRFSRKYAYQVLILEELIRYGVEVVFLRNPPGHGPEENLLLQVQGMIAEYERAKIWSAAAEASSTPPAVGRSTSSAAHPTAIVTSASTTREARRVTRSWPKRLASCGRSLSGLGRSAAQSAKSADAFAETVFPHGPANQPGTARWSG